VRGSRANANQLSTHSLSNNVNVLLLTFFVDGQLLYQLVSIMLYFRLDAICFITDLTLDCLVFVLQASIGLL